MSQLSRKCVPFTPFDRELSRATIAIVTAAGVHRKDQSAFNIADELGDLTFRVIGSDAQADDLMVTHHHYDHTDADRDINVVFPIDALRALAAEGVIGGTDRGVAHDHVPVAAYGRGVRQATALELA